MTFRKDYVSAWLGCAIVLFHVLLVLFLVTVFERSATDQVAATEISIPMTAAYALAVVKWVIDNQGRLRRRNKVGLPYVVILATLCFGTLAGLGGGVWFYLEGDLDYQQLNWLFVSLESAFGGMLVLFFNDLFSSNTE